MTQMDELVYTENLSKFFGDAVALDGLNLRVPSGISGFVGPNGAGKTTTINVLLGLLKPDQGNARVFDRDCWHDSYRIRRKLGVLHEKPSYPGNFSGRRYLEHVAYIYDINEPKERAKEILKEVGLQDSGEKAIKTYSAGMTQRLGLAQALISNPELAILDEPTANLDPLGRIEFLEKIKGLHAKSGLNFFISTHILPELEKVCDYVSIVNDGAIIDQGTLTDLADRYSANVYRVDVSDPELFSDKVKKIKAVEKTWIESGVVYCKVRNVNEFYKEVPKIASENGLMLKSFQPLHATLEEVFATLVGRKEE